MLPNDPAPPDATAPATWQYQQPPVAPVVERRRGSPAVAIAVVLVGLLAGTALFASGFLIGERAALQPGTPASRADVFQPFWDTYQTIQRRYAGGEINDQALVRGAIKGMVDALGDPYSAYLTPEEYQAGLQGLSGEFEGIGAEIGTTNAKGETSDCSTFGPDCFLVIISPIEGSPAEKAGLKPGDTVLAVDGSGLEGLTVDGARDRIRGKRGTDVVLTIKRGDQEPFDVSITRDVIEQREVIHEDLADGTIGYIRVTGFSDKSAEAYHAALAADVAAGRKKVILDLRGNPGGYVTAAQHIVSEFISSGPIFWEEDADGKQVETDALGGGVATAGDIQLIVLIDRGSASASEIVAGALQDRGRATIVGETSFGKGTVQQWIELPNTGALKLTIAKWLTPDKHWIHHVGIVPDVVVTPPDQVPAGSDPVKDKAVEILSGTGVLDRAA
ncbi:MAG TPA: S41 family peptidase [Candidatus Limnocylindrales bacterium]|jgi:carboxyl-terminal processing protease|nr:S41 family peptidase [Candidatus Limnocylindrales bacterium]